ncbi:alkaline phosphatase D family protein [Phenylobacterium sp.]|uniref:alkaline phosphatase D family protein n=1 Tax=Phenylobacterium sp. TaxID=1871053 RepID=UPI00391AE0A3
MFSRRHFLIASGSAPLWAPGVSRGAPARYPFTLGVASGSPRETSVVLWTRLAPEPTKGGGMPAGAVAVRYRVCADPAMRRTVRDGLFVTSDADAHSVHVLVDGLEPGREYWYQFHLGEDDSPVGRTRTSSRKDAAARLALASCQNWQSGRYAAFADMAKWAPDCVIHVGDYIYEGGVSPLGQYTRDVGGGRKKTFEVVRQHDGPEIVTLWDYRNRYGLYKGDPDLQAAHAASPWIVALDDHEVDNNWAGDTPQDPWAQTPLEFQVRKAAAFKAYWEHMPLERPPAIAGVDAHLQLYGAYRFGPAQVCLLDTRQYRADQVCSDAFPRGPSCEALQDPARSMTGLAQEAWLLGELARSDATYNVLAQQTWFAPYRYNAPPAAPDINTDQWDGYPVQRQRLIDAMAQTSNPIVLSGDWHCAAAMRIHRDPADARSPRVGHEFAGTSISSDCPWADSVHDAKDANPHAAYVNGERRGYVRCTADARTWTAEYRGVADPRDRASAVVTDAEFRTRDM